MAENNKKFNARIQLKNDISTNWDKAENFKPLPCEPIIVSDNKKKIKIGDGETVAKDLPFLLDSVPVEEGSAQGSVQITNGTSQAIGEYSIATGVRNTAGSYGWKIAAYTANDTTMTVYDPNNTLLSADGAYYSIRFDNNYDLYGTIMVLKEMAPGVRQISISNPINDTLYEEDSDQNNIIRLFKKIENGNAILFEPIEGGNILTGHYNSAEGMDNIASGLASHAEGRGTLAEGAYSHTEGRSTIAAWGSHAEGQYTRAMNLSSHTEGQYTEASGQSAHAEGIESQAIGNGSHAEGSKTTAEGPHSHAEGWSTKAVGWATHTEGRLTEARNDGAHAEGKSTFSSGSGAHAEGTNQSDTTTDDLPDYTFTLSDKTAKTVQGPKADHRGTHAEGVQTLAHAYASHAEGKWTLAEGKMSHAEGLHTKAIGESSHAEGYKVVASGKGAHAEGYSESIYKIYGEGSFKTPLVTTPAKEIVQSCEISMLNYRANYYYYFNKIRITTNGQIYLTWNNSNNETLVHNGQYFLTFAEGSSNNFIFGTDPQTISKEFYDWCTQNFIIDSGFLTEKLATSSGEGSHVEGCNTEASGKASHAEGIETVSSGQATHAEGIETVSSGQATHAEGYRSTASGWISHAEGNGTTASGENGAHAEGKSTTASGESSHAEGQSTNSTGLASHTEGSSTNAKAAYAHAEGLESIAHTLCSHAEGYKTEAGNPNNSYTNYAHAEGDNTKAYGHAAHAEGRGTVAASTYAHAEGWNTTANACGAHAEGTCMQSPSEGTGELSPITVTLTSGYHIRVKGPVADHRGSHAEGSQTVAAAYASHAEGRLTVAEGEQSHAEGRSTKAEGSEAHAEGHNTTASGEASHAEGYRTISSNRASHAEGKETTASGDCSHAEGDGTTATEQGSHAEGGATIASGLRSHAEGLCAVASGHTTHAEGWYTIAAGDYQHVQGRCNVEDKQSKYLHIVGNGTSATARANAHTLDWSGNAWFAGDVKVGGTGQDDTDAKTLATTDYVDSKSLHIYTDATIKSFVSNDLENNIASGNYAHAEGSGTMAKGNCSHVEGVLAVAEGVGSHAGGRARAEEEGDNGYGGIKTYPAGEIKASGEGSFAHGYSCPGWTQETAAVVYNPGHIIASGKGAVAFGYAGEYWGTGVTEASGDGSFAIGQNTKAMGKLSFAQGVGSNAEEEVAIAMGDYCQAQGKGSFASGYYAISGGEYSQAFGFRAATNANYATAFGEETIASASAQTVVGSYNEEDSNAKFIVGVGDGNSGSRANAFTAGKDEEGSYITIGESRFQGLVDELGDNETVTLSQKALKELLNDIYNRLTALEPIKISGFLHWGYEYGYIDPDFPPTNTIPYEAASVDQKINFIYNDKEYTSIHIEITPESGYNQNIEQTYYYYTLGFVFLNEDTGDSVVANNRSVLIDFGTEKQIVSQEFYDLITKYAIFKDIDLSNSITYTITQTEKMAKYGIISHVINEYIDFISNGNIYTQMNFNPDVSYSDDLALDIEWDYESIEPTSATWTNEGFKTITIIDQDQLSDEFRALLEEWSS